MAIVKWGFRRFYSSQQAVSEISELVAGSNVQQSERSSAASVTSKKPIRGKVAIAARKKTLESFVDKYRAMNQGKFPTPSGAKKEVGGSYYFVKKIIQEMEYNVKVSSVEKEPVKDDKRKTITKEIAIESSSESQEVLDSQITMDQKFYEDRGLESVKVSSVEKEPVKDDKSKPITKELAIESSSENQEVLDSQITMDQKIYEDRGLESVKVSSVGKELGDNFAFKDSESTPEKQHDEIQNITSDIPEQQKDEESKSEQQHDETQNITSEIPEQQKDEDSEAEQQHDEIQNITSDMPGPQKEESKAEKQHETQNIKSDIPEQQKDEELKAEQNHDKIQNITSDMPQQQKIEVLEAEKHHHETQYITSDMPDDESKPEKHHDETQNIASDVPEQQKDEFREKPSLWGNLKMLATGLINIWKK
nr:hypothetical protein [Tanacetum cinerariifolium]